MQRADDGEHRPVTESVIQQVARPPGRRPRRPSRRRNRPARPPSPPRFCGNRSAGRIITSVDHDCWPKNAMLNSTIAIIARLVTCSTLRPSGLQR